MIGWRVQWAMRPSSVAARIAMPMSESSACASDDARTRGNFMRATYSSLRRFSIRRRLSPGEHRLDAVNLARKVRHVGLGLEVDLILQVGADAVAFGGEPLAVEHEDRQQDRFHPDQQTQ